MGEKTDYNSYQQEENNVEFTEVERFIDYRDINHYVPKLAPEENRELLGTLINMQTNELKIDYWEKLLDWGKDSPACFMFMLKQVINENFRFHVNEDESTLEHKWIFKKLQLDKTYRVEMVPSNIDLKTLVSDLNEIRNYHINVIFNIGGNSHFLNSMLYSMRGLVWLNLSDSSLTYSKFKTIVNIINRKGLLNLKALVLTNNPALRLKDLKQELKTIHEGDLSYLETDLVDDEIGSHNRILEKIEVPKEFKIKTDGQKLVYLVEHGVIVKGRTPSGYKEVTIDYGICDGGWGTRVRLGLANSVKAIGYKVNLNKKAALLLQKSIDEKVAVSRVVQNPVKVRRNRFKNGKNKLLRL